MSDKSKLGFNINPKNYDELNSTDNLITSGSDSGWLGKKLQGDDSNDLDLSKINPLFDKDLYEKYRPGVNTNDGSVNQDIWGYKCFNSPVSFRNCIYGDTYSIQSIENDDMITGAYDGISIQPCQKNITHDGTFDSKYYSYKLHSEIIGITHDKCVTSTYAGKMWHPITFNEPDNYQLFSNAAINGSSIENMTLTSTADTKYYCQSYIYNNPSDTDLHIYNGVKIYSEINSKSEYTDEINIVSSKCDTTSSTRPYKVSRVTVGTACDNDPILEKESQVSGNCIRMYSTNGNEFNLDHTNDNISSIIITPDYISISAKNNANQSTDNPYIKIDGTDNSITLHTGKLNLPDTIEVTTAMANFANKASILAKDINAQNYIIANDSSVIPNSNNTVSLGASSAMYKDVYAYNFYGLAAAAERLRYKDPRSGMSVDLLSASSLVSILPYQHNTVSIGSENMSFGNIYADKFIGTADKAKADAHGHNIATTYFNKSLNNTITGTTTISRPGDVLRILPNSLDEEESCSINIVNSGVDMRYKTILNMHQQDNTSLACSLSLYAYHNNDVSSFSILPSVESATGGIVRDNVALNIGGKNNYFTNIYCKKFPTITGDTNKTSVGNIRLLAIQSPYMPDIDIYKTIGHGSEIQSPIIIDGKEFNIYIARLGTVVENGANIIKLMGDIDGAVVAGKWRLLSSVYITNDRAGIMYTPVLAMRVE